MHKPPASVSLFLVGTISLPYLYDAFAHPSETNAPKPPKAALVLTATATGGTVADIVINPTTGSEHRVTPPFDVRRPHTTGSS